MYENHEQRLQPRLELSGQKVDQTFAKYTRGTLQISNKNWFRKLKLCWFEEEQASDIRSFSFKLFEVLEMLEIQKTYIFSYWQTLVNEIAHIPSKNFKKLTIITESAFNQSHLMQLTDKLGLIKRKVTVEVRCKGLNLEPVFSWAS